MAQTGKYLLHKHKDLSSIHTTNIKRQTWWPTLVMSTLDRWEKEDPLDLLI